MNRALLVCLVCSTLSAAQPDLFDRAQTGLDAVRAEAIEAHIRFLADDLLEGRAPGTNGHRIAARYMEAQFRSLGLDPAGSDGYYQPVPLLRSRSDPDRSAMTLVTSAGEEPLAYGKDFIVSPLFTSDHDEVEGEVVFVGFAIAAPELDYDDFAGVDLKGKIAVYFTGAPESFPHNQRAYYSSGGVKLDNIAERGAVGAISITPPQNAIRPWEVTVERAKRGSAHWMDSGGQPYGALPAIRGSASLSEAGAQALFAGAPQSLDEVFDRSQEGGLEAFPLPVKARIETTNERDRLDSENVAAKLPGSDPELTSEYVVYTAHIDAFGVIDPIKGDAIYNGAHDNASGAAILIEIARAFSALPDRPRRSILFVAVTGEEWGLLGSDYFAEQPTVPFDSMVADISMDMPFLFHPLLDVVPYGAEHSSLSEAVGLAANRLGLGISPDPLPKQVLFIRSDHFSFVRRGIPALFVKSGFKTGDDRAGAKINAEWRKNVYHTPFDEADQAFDFEAGAQHARFNFLVGYAAAMQTTRPRWNDGDFFGETFGRN